MKCKICNAEASRKLKGLRYLGRFDGEVYQCPNCKYLQVFPADWLEDAYTESIAITDTGIVARNLLFVKRITVLLTIIDFKLRIPSLFLLLFKSFVRYFCKKKFRKYNLNILDFGGGYGLLVRMLRDVGFNAEWRDLFTKNLFARGFESKSKNYDCILSFEVLEHLENPLFELDNIFLGFRPNLFVFSTLLYGEEVPDKNWWYFSPETGQHIGFYNERTLRFIADKYGYFYISIDSGFHVFSKKKLHSDTIRFFVLRSDYFFPTFAKVYRSLTLTDNKKMINSII
ncbi:methyltransferase domain protein [Leptospira wolbachii serovar Codice str. CDC]|uniref:Methyltransferase domain protein n=1 Tax=Leptospira wolbachii serovar Codice str. CDC TaxID=1218599 RepID=R9A814_9LEPT|nr:class I SAM-dependent methyltransferase [Leptospira wolbachii]EOQ98194.1 methyltransferase domain protein [Leptospira wolbachii serovar Codice str. CDC]